MDSRDLSIWANAEIRVDVPERLAGIMEGSLRPEAERPTSERSSVNVANGDGGLVIRIEGSDVAALRAAFNSYLRWVSSILDVVDSVDAQGKTSTLHAMK